MVRPRRRLVWITSVVMAACTPATSHPSAEPPPPPVDTAPSAPVAEKVVQLNRPGEAVDVEAALPVGHVVIVDFWAEWCGACKVLEAKFMAEIADEPRVVVRRVDVGDGDTPAAQRYEVGALPHVRIYDGTKALRFVLVGNDVTTTAARAMELVRELK